MRHGNQTWSLKIVSDNLMGDRAFCARNLLDDDNRKAISIELDISSLVERVIRVLELLLQCRPALTHIRLDNVPEFISQQLVYSLAVRSNRVRAADYPSACNAMIGSTVFASIGPCNRCGSDERSSMPWGPTQRPAILVQTP